MNGGADRNNSLTSDRLYMIYVYSNQHLIVHEPQWRDTMTIVLSQYILIQRKKFNHTVTRRRRRRRLQFPILGRGLFLHFFIQPSHALNPSILWIFLAHSMSSVISSLAKSSQRLLQIPPLCPLEHHLALFIWKIPNYSWRQSSDQWPIVCSFHFRSPSSRPSCWLSFFGL